VLHNGLNVCAWEKSIKKSKSIHPSIHLSVCMYCIYVCLEHRGIAFKSSCPKQTCFMFSQPRQAGSFYVQCGKVNTDIKVATVTSEKKRISSKGDRFLHPAAHTVCDREACTFLKETLQVSLIKELC